MDALSDAIVRLLRRQDETDRRLARIEGALGVGAAPPQPSEPEQAPPPVEIAAEPGQTGPPALDQATLVPATPALETPPPLPPPRPPEPDQPREFETQVGLTWISRIGAVTLVFAVAFIFKYAVDNQWIGETGRVVLGILAGLACVGIGDRIWRAGHKIYAQAIFGLGIAILYLSFYASFAFYHLLPQSVPFVLMTLTTALSGALALGYDAPAIAVLGLAGGYLTPVLLSTGEDHPVILFSYVFILDLGAMALVRVRRWIYFEAISFGATFVLYYAWFLTHFAAEKETVATVFALLFYALFLFAELRALVVTAQVLVTVVLAAIWPAKAALYLATTTGAAAAGLITAERRKRPALATFAFAAFWIVYTVWVHGLAEPRPIGTVLAFLTVAFLLFFVWAPWRLLIRRAPVDTPEFVVLALDAAAYFAASYYLLEDDYHAYLGLFAIALAALYLALGIEVWRQQPAEGADERPVLLSLGVALTLITLAAPIQFTAYRITIGWAVEGAALTWIGKRLASSRLLYIALCVFLLVLFRLWIIDSWMYSQATDYTALANARFLTFLVSTASLWAAALWMGGGKKAILTYVGGHIVLLGGLMLEVTGWAERTAAPENVSNLESTSISILMALYAFVLIVVGVVTRTVLNRVMGLALIGLVVAKLYLYDVWLLGRIYRIAAFAALGALLLITSYLYSRYREKIEAWWKDETPSS